VIAAALGLVFLITRFVIGFGAERLMPLASSRWLARRYTRPWYSAGGARRPIRAEWDKRVRPPARARSPLEQHRYRRKA
jgi:hypothetical protein